jgi:CheY-specific phosphatase CheX
MMAKVVEYTDRAVENFFENTLEISCRVEEKERLSDIYTTQIGISHNDEAYYFFIGMGENMLKILSSKLLFEEEPDQETMIDLLNESANLIIGNAKVLWEESEEGVVLQLTTPEYQGYFEENLSKEFEKRRFFNADSESIMIGIDSVKSREIV